MSETAYSGENKMGSMPINRLLVSMSLPMIASMLVQALYNIVDSIFVAQISENALTAVSLAFPVQSLLIAVSSGTCVGINALLSRSLGERRQDEANLAAANGVFLAVISCAVFALFGIFGSRIFFASQTVTPEVIEFGAQYLTICLICSFGIFGEMTFERLMQSTGRTFYSMITQGTGAIINIILDPIMIFGLFGFPRLGIRGAAIATVTGQIIAMLLAVYLNHTKNPDIRLSLRGFKPNKRVIGLIYTVGVPSIVMQSITSVMTFGMNRILIMFSETAVSVLGVYFKLQSFIFMPVFGLNNGLIPIVAYNYGAASRKRIMDTIKLEIGVPALRAISFSFLFAGYCIIIGSVFQALGNGVYSLIVSVARQLLCILPLAWFFANTWGLHAVWYSFALAELMSLTLSTLLFRRIYVKKIRGLDARQA